MRVVIRQRLKRRDVEARWFRSAGWWREGEILTLVRASLSAPDPLILASRDRVDPSQPNPQAEYPAAVAEAWDAYLDVADEFDDTGEGVGVEGDLDTNDD
jgi:hypothetical protein